MDAGTDNDIFDRGLSVYNTEYKHDKAVQLSRVQTGTDIREPPKIDASTLSWLQDPKNTPIVRNRAGVNTLLKLRAGNTLCAHSDPNISFKPKDSALPGEVGIDQCYEVIKSIKNSNTADISRMSKLIEFCKIKIAKTNEPDDQCNLYLTAENTGYDRFVSNELNRNRFVSGCNNDQDIALETSYFSMGY